MFYSTVNMIIMSHKKGKTIVFGVYDVKSKAGTQQKISYECKSCRSSNRFPWSIRMRAQRNGPRAGGLGGQKPVYPSNINIIFYKYTACCPSILRLLTQSLEQGEKQRSFLNREHLKKGSVLRIRFRFIRIQIQSFSLSY